MLKSTEDLLRERVAAIMAKPDSARTTEDLLAIEAMRQLVRGRKFAAEQSQAGVTSR